jgi:hypothetical protein
MYASLSRYVGFEDGDDELQPSSEAEYEHENCLAASIEIDVLRDYILAAKPGSQIYGMRNMPSQAAADVICNIINNEHLGEIIDRRVLPSDVAQALDWRIGGLADANHMYYKRQWANHG